MCKLGAFLRVKTKAKRASNPTYCITFAAEMRQCVSKSKDNMTNCKLQTAKPAQRRQSIQQGLYQPDYEHDACGVGMVVNIHGGKSHELVDNALKVLENMEHRGAETRDKTGDGAGIMVQIPHELFCCRASPCLRKESMVQDWCSCPRTRRRSRRF